MIALYNMIATGTHNWSMSDEDHVAFTSYFDMFVAQEISVWRDFHSYWMDPDQMIPTYIVRYEDLLTAPYKTLLGLFSFLLNQRDLTGTLIESLIAKHTKKGVKKEVYKPRVGKINANKKKYSQSQISQMKKLAGQMIRRMGYLKSSKSIEKNETEIFSDDEDVASSKDYECDSLIKYGKLRQVKMRYRYHEFNDNTIDFICNDKFRESVKCIDTLKSVEINYEGDLIRQRTARDPGGRGSKMFKDVLRGHVDVIAPDGTVQHSKSKHKKK